MARKITALPAEEICIEFNDKEIVATFNMRAVGFMQQELLKKRNKKNSILELDYDLLYYAYCFRLRRTEEEFFSSSLEKVIRMLDIAQDEALLKSSMINDQSYASHYFSTGERSSESTTITSMKEVKGFL